MGINPGLAYGFREIWMGLLLEMHTPGGVEYQGSQPRSAPVKNSRPIRPGNTVRTPEGTKTQ